MAVSLSRQPSLLLAEQAGDSAFGPDLLAALDEEDRARLLQVSSRKRVAAGDMVFAQGDARDGIYVILSGQVRIFYGSPAGREITLAYWSPGNYVGGPEVFGNSPHMWSGQAVGPTGLLHLRGAELRVLVAERPRLAIALIEAMEHKCRCLSALVQMLGTRSASQRLARLLALIGEFDGIARPEGIVIGRHLTQEDLARMVGSTRQWVSSTLERFREQGLVEVTATRIIIPDLVRLQMAGG